MLVIHSSVSSPFKLQLMPPPVPVCNRSTMFFPALACKLSRKNLVSCTFSWFQGDKLGPFRFQLQKGPFKGQAFHQMTQVSSRKSDISSFLTSTNADECSWVLLSKEDDRIENKPILGLSALPCIPFSWFASAQVSQASESIRPKSLYEIGELFELGIQLTYLLLLLALLGVGSFFVIRQVLVRRELDLSAKELQEQVRSGDASATELFELGAVMLRRKFYPAATKFLLQAIEKWDGDDQDLAQVYNALGVSYVRDGKLEKGISQFENAVKLQPGYVTAWNNLGDAYEKNKDLKSALKAFEEVLLFDPNNKVARPRRDALKEKVTMYKGVPVKSKKN